MPHGNRRIYGLLRQHSTSNAGTVGLAFIESHHATDRGNHSNVRAFVEAIDLAFVVAIGVADIAGPHFFSIGQP